MILILDVDSVVTSPTVTEIFPLVAPAGTVATIVVAVVPALTSAVTSLNFTILFDETLLKPDPSMVTTLPTKETSGLNELMIKGRATNSLALSIVTPSRVTLTLPVVVPTGTLTVNVVRLLAITTAVTPLNFTV